MGQEAGLRALCGVLHQVPTLNSYFQVSKLYEEAEDFFLLETYLEDSKITNYPLVKYSILIT